MKALQLKPDFYWTGVLDKDLRVFDIIMMTEFGTTYNSYVLKCGDKTVLFETAKEKFFDDYLETLSQIVDVKTIDYIVVDHTEPDHAGSIQKILDICPRAKILATPTAIGFLKQVVNDDFYSIAVKDGEEIKIGNKTLRFHIFPNLHWPDTMYTYIVEDKILVTCDSFGSHYAHDGILRSTVTDTEGYLRATKYYFDNILGPFKQPYMTTALQAVRQMQIDMICPGHGPVLDSHIEELMDIYEGWCAVPQNPRKKVVIPYVSAYGYTGQLAEQIAKGIQDNGDIEVKLYDMVTADAAEVSGEIASADGILFGTPTILCEALKPIWDLTTGMYPPIHGGKLASAFGSYGWSGEGVPHILERLKQIRLRVVDGFCVRLKPSENDLVEAYEYGYRFADTLLQKQKAKSGGRSGLVKCLVCGEIFDASLETCPVCGVGKENFVPVDLDEVTFRMDTAEKFVILGGGTAAVNAAKAIRDRNETADIILLSDETELPYDRPMLTKNMFGDIANGAIASKEAAWYRQNMIDLRLGVRVSSMDIGRKEIRLEHGEVLHYDKCIYALGSHSFVPPIPGATLSGVTPIRTIADVENIKQMALTAKHAVVIGGGVLGLEAAWELRKEKLQVTVLEGMPQLMLGKIDAVAADMMCKVADKVGVTIHTGVKIAEIKGDGKAEAVVLADGTEIPADIVIMSTGVRANKELAEDAGILANRAVIVSDKMQTSDSSVYAAGDCAEFDGANIAIWPVAMEMGRIAGANAAGDALPYIPQTNGMTMHALHTTLYAIGDVGTKENISYKTLEIRDDKKLTLEKFYFKNNALCGAILLGDTSRMKDVTEGIANKVSFHDFFVFSE